MKRCVQCHAKVLRKADHQDSLTIAGRVFSRKIPALRCSNCGETYIHGPDLGALERDATSVIAREGPCSGETFQFLRKFLGMRGADLAELLDVAPETLSRWETGQRPVDRASWLALSVMVLEHLEGKTATLDRIKALFTQAKPTKHVQLKPRRA
ncbi:MAG TPA: helix-turn-helix domain-containing protein [Myxococcales bacterium]|jgi:DNA-binding transcriptional regulator YiaG